MNRMMLRAAVCALACAAAFGARAADAPARTLPLALAHEVVDRTIALVETKGVYPRRRDEYAQAKQDLLAAVDGKAADVDQAVLQARIRALLATLDADGHSFLLPAVAPGQPLVPMPVRAPMPQFQLVATRRGTVLRWTPPATTYSTPETRAEYVAKVYDEGV